jgi:hypothetical protein
MNKVEVVVVVMAMVVGLARSFFISILLPSYLICIYMNEVVMVVVVAAAVVMAMMVGAVAAMGLIAFLPSIPSFASLYVSSLHFTSLHFTSLHFTSLHFLPSRPSFTSFLHFLPSFLPSFTRIYTNPELEFRAGRLLLRTLVSEGDGRSFLPSRRRPVVQSFRPSDNSSPSVLPTIHPSFSVGGYPQFGFPPPVLQGAEPPMVYPQVPKEGCEGRVPRCQGRK